MFLAALALQAATTASEYPAALQLFGKACLEGQVTLSRTEVDVVAPEAIPGPARYLYTYLPSELPRISENLPVRTELFPAKVFKFKASPQAYLMVPDQKTAVCAVLVHANFYREAMNYISSFMRPDEKPHADPDSKQIAFYQPIGDYQISFVRGPDWTLIAATPSQSTPTSEGRK